MLLQCCPLMRVTSSVTWIRNTASVLAFHLIDFSRYFFEQSNTRQAA